MIARSGKYFGQPIIFACDGKCEKAWGINNRPRIYLGDPTQTVYPNEEHHYLQDETIDEDDHVSLADDELGIAPIDPGTYEGGHAKPQSPEERLNKWCCRECERSVIVDDIDIVEDFQLPDFSKRRYNISSSDPDHATIAAT